MHQSKLALGECPSPKIVRQMTAVRIQDQSQAIARLEHQSAGTSELLRWSADLQYYRDVLAVLDAYAWAHKVFRVAAGLVKVRRGLGGEGVAAQIRAVHVQVLSWFEEVVGG